SYWSTHLSAATQNSWHEPANWVHYRENAPPASNSCGISGRRWLKNSFYCPLDNNIYLDLDFLESLPPRVKTSSNAAAMLLIAHEFGHHIQALHQRKFTLGIGQELEADCYAGVYFT